MSVRVTLDDLAEFREQLRHLPEALALDAGPIVQQTAEQAGQETASHYPRGKTGHLQQGVSTSGTTTRAGAAWTVRSRAPHASIYEKGTRVRRTRKGANRGVMPAAPEENRLVPRAIRLRARMVDRLKELLRQAGFVVGA